MNRLSTLILSFILSFASLVAQDTFSIVAVDSTTGEVGSAGASCVDLSAFPGFSTGFLGELFPNVGAINTQAAYDAANQSNARRMMNEGNTPQEIIDWLKQNDIGRRPESRQYGIVAMVDGAPQSAAHTGSQNIDYKNHNLGPNYSIQGNILSGQNILDRMEQNFLNEKGDLACKLMAAMQGAKVVGADSRCASNGTSSLFAFIKVSQPTDQFGSPSLELGVRTRSGSRIEPIDSLQMLYDEERRCQPNSTEDAIKLELQIFPNPANDQIELKVNYDQPYFYQLYNMQGILMGREDSGQRMNISHLAAGNYIVQLIYKNEDLRVFSKIQVVR